MPKIVILTRTKNRIILLPRAINSVAQQTFSDYLHIIINDGGDYIDISEITGSLSKGKKEKIHLIQIKDSKGMEAASNLAIQSSQSELITFLDDDDSWEPDFLATTISYLDAHQDVMGVATKCNYIQEEIRNNKVKILHSRSFKAYIDTHSLYDICKENNILNHSFVYRRESLNTIGLYDEKLRVLGDWDFNLRFLQHFDIAAIQLKLANYHIRVTNSSYGNTITKNIDLHKHTRMIINNRELRKDLLAGKLGIGYLINSAPHTVNLSSEQKLMRLYYKISDQLKIVKIFRDLFPNKHTKILRKRFHE